VNETLMQTKPQATV